MKFVINSLEEVAEPFRGEYEARNGKFYLKTEGDYAPLTEANTKLAEFRDNNRSLNSLKTELETKLKSFEGIDPAEYTALKTRIAELEKGGVKDLGDIGEKIKAAVASAVTPLEKKLAEREASEAAARADLAKKDLENQLREVGIKMGVDERAIPDYVNRGTQVFKLVDGKPAPRKADGSPIFSKEHPAEELSMEEWAGQLQNEAPFLFKPSRGGGAGGTGNGGPAGGPKKVISSDPLVFGQNLEAIAKGEVIVQQ